MFSDKNIFQLFDCRISLPATEGTCIGLCSSGTSIPGSFSTSYFEPSSESIIFIERFQHVGYI